MGCYNCGMQCLNAFNHHGRTSVMKCTSMLTFMVYAKYLDYDWALDCYSMIEEWGLDIQAFPLAVAFAIDLYERGILTREDTDGLHLEFGNPEVFSALMEKIVKREGIGDVLANGIMRAARQIGRGAEERVFVVKGREMRLTSTAAYATPAALQLTIGTKDWGGQRSGEIQRILKRPWRGFREGSKEAAAAYQGDGWYINPREMEEREAFIKKGHFFYPKEYEEVFLREYNRDGSDFDSDPESFCAMISYDHQHYSITDSIGICHRTNGAIASANTRALLTELIATATGMDIDEDELTVIARRIVNMARAFNVRLGLTRQDDIPPKIFFERDPAPPRRRLDRDVFDKYLDTYYRVS
ncbi:MAG: aldehyde ferredoxin oxidoreductase C-terminal domain-containing protein, partial [Dehalococcoidales bacterium]|nr:aldehyde ferredoxin oxidoreductase C-terminal domain-containing protein [Dehalococcoidales bacterium]